MAEQIFIWEETMDLPNHLAVQLPTLNTDSYSEPQMSTF